MTEKTPPKGDGRGAAWGPRQVLLRTAGVLALAAVYFAAAKLGLSLALAAEQVSAVWPPTGIALAAVLVFGYRAWPGIALGAFLANATANEPLGTACAIAAGNTLEALAGAWLLRRLVGFGNGLQRLRDVLALIALAASLSTTVSATIGVTSLCLGGVQPWTAYGSLWWVWWLGDAMGALVVAPVLLTWAADSRRHWPAARLAEALVLLAGLVAAGWAVFSGRLTAGLGDHSLAYCIFPFVIWAALRFGQRGATAVTLVASALAVWGTVEGKGPFGTGPAHERLLLLQIFTAVVAVTALFLAAALAERRRDAQRTAALHAVTRLLVESATLADAAPQIVRAISDSMGWQVGAVWRVDPDARVLRCVGVWHRGPARFPEFEAACRQQTFEPGTGLPGRVWAGGRPVCIPDVVHDGNFPRAPVAAREGLHGALGFPIRLGEEVLGVIEFFSPEVRQPEDDVLRIMATVGSQVGQFIERERVQEAVRRSEARKTAVLESALDAIITMDHEGNIVEFNPAAEKTFGYARAEVIGRPMGEVIVPPSLREKHRLALARYLATGEGAILGQRLELPALRADGTEFPAELTVTRIPCPGPPMFTGYIRDITERKRAEEELREAGRRKDEFLALLAHELRNPLAPIRNGVEIMRQVGLSDPQLRGVRDMLERQVLHVSRLVDDLLDVSRITRGMVTLREEPTDLAAVVARAVETSRPLIDARRHELTLSLPPEPLPLWADPTRLAQVFANLLNNAAKYTREGGRIRLTAAREGSHVAVRVHDSGIGIAPEMLPRIFDLFAQADRSLERSDGGLGIGLTLVRSLVEMHGGSVRALSEGLGKGSEFLVRLPLLAEPPAVGRAAPAGAARPTAGAGPARRILVVDDNPDAVDSLGLLLRLQGHDVRTAHDGPAALEAAREYQPDVVLLDIGLPGMDGYEVARRIRLLPALRRVLLVAMTGYGQEEDKRRSREAGFNAHLVKPADPDALQGLLAQPA